MNYSALEISAGLQSEYILQAILSELGDEQLDQMTVDRQIASSSGLVGEPVTTAVAIGATTTVMVAALRILERHLEHRRQKEAFKMIAQGFDKDPELGKLFNELAVKNAEVAASMGIAKESWAKPE